jgi:hypothetical protein
MVWSPQLSGALRKRLETRHFGDMQTFVQYVCMLGSHQVTPGQALPMHLQEVAKSPARDGCTCQMRDHGGGSVDMQAAANMATAAAAGSDTMDPMQFRIPRHNNNRHIREYLASQRSMRVPARPSSSVRARAAPQQYSRSSSISGPSTSGPGQMSSAHYLSPLPPGVQLGSTHGTATSPMFDPQSSGYGTAGMGLMSQVGGMPPPMPHSAGAGVGGDVHMSGMAGFSSPYATAGLESPMTPGEPSSLQNHGWITDDRHQYVLEE